MALNPIQTEPTAPAAPGLNMCASRVARPLFLLRDDASRPWAPLESPAFSTHRLIIPTAGATALSTVGTTAPAESGTGASFINATTNYVSSQLAKQYTTATSANAEGGMRAVPGASWRGNAALLGGLFFHCRFVLDTISAAGRVFVGLSNQATNVHVIGEPSASAGDFIGILSDAADANLWIGSKDGTTYRDQVDLGAATKAALTMYDFWMYSEPNGSGIYATVDKWLASTRTRLVDNAFYTLNIPLATELNLRTHCQIGAAATGVAQVIRFCSNLITTPR